MRIKRIYPSFMSKPTKVSGRQESVGKSEEQIEGEILFNLTVRGIPWWRFDIKGKPVKKGEFFDLKKNENRGFSDILVCYKGRMLCFEVKKNNGIASTYQLDQQKKVHSGEGVYLFVTSWTEVEEVLNSIK